MTTPSIDITESKTSWQLTSVQRVPQPIDVVFPFFAAAENLERVTPDFLCFHILRAPSVPMHIGARIDYRLRLHGIPLAWQSRIDDWMPPTRFVDVQVHGPFRQWRHVHDFVSDGNSTLVRDTVDFDVYFPWLSRRLLLPWIAADLRRVFEYRHQAITSIFAT